MGETSRPPDHLPPLRWLDDELVLDGVPMRSCGRHTRGICIRDRDSRLEILREELDHRLLDRSLAARWCPDERRSDWYVDVEHPQGARYVVRYAFELARSTSFVHGILDALPVDIFVRIWTGTMQDGDAAVLGQAVRRMHELTFPAEVAEPSSRSGL